MQKAKCYVEIALNLDLINSILTHVTTKNLISVLEFKISENIEDEDYDVSVLIRHHLTGSTELVSIHHIRKYYS